jgi:outer membrane protein assembly factor BamA
MVFGSSCSLSKSLKEGETLYTGAEIVFQKEDEGLKTNELATELASVIESPKANGSILGLRLKLRLYNLFYTEKEKGLTKWLQKTLGTPPVIYDENITKQSIELLENRAINNGYFNNEVNADVQTKGLKTKVKYFVKIERPYLIDTVQYSISDSMVAIKMEAIRDSTLLKMGRRYDLDLIKQERVRIANKMRASGYFYFQDEYLLFRADTTQERRKIEMELLLKEKTPNRSLQPQYIRQVVVYPDYNLKRKASTRLDTLQNTEMTLIYEKLLLSPEELQKAILLEKNALYSTEFHQRTLERLSNMQTYQYIDVQFEKVKNQDSLVDVTVYLTPRKKRTIEGALGMSYTRGVSFGPEVSFNYTNRNLFKGAEVLKVNGTTTFNFPLTNQVLTTQEQSLEIQLLKPRVWFPIRQILESKRLIGNTFAKLTFSRQQLQLPMESVRDLLETGGFSQLLAGLNNDEAYAPTADLNAIEFSFGYQWRRQAKFRHQLSPLEIVFQIPTYSISELRSFLIVLSNTSQDRSLGLNLEKMVIYKPNYVFLYDSRLKKIREHNYYYRGKYGYSTNRLLNNVALVDKNKIEGQFLHFENDIRYFYKPNAKTTFAFRVSPSIAYPLKNEVILPFFDLFVVGGPNSVRAFQPRRVGPGTREPINENFFFIGTGDIRLETSFEIRQKLTSLVELALFVDAGNTWLYDGGADASAKFDVNTFYKELASGAGFGLRFDFSVLLIRTDLAYPLTKPWLPEGERFVADKFSFGELNFNLAFGYPF